MSVNLDKNRSAILAAYEDVHSSKSATDWALFSYEGNSNDLKVVSTGDGGIEELMEDLNSGKIMYVYARISDPRTAMTKFILINWQGEGAPVVRKGTCANHIRDIEKLLTGAHLTVYARTEDDIDNEKILKDLCLVKNSLNIKEQRIMLENEGPKAPVGANYNRVIPNRDINPTERDTFWKKEEEEERKRLELEREKKRQDQVLVEEDRRRQQKVSQEKLVKEQEVQLQQEVKRQEAQRSLEKLTIIADKPQEKQAIITSPTRVMTGAEKLRQERNQEAKMLIGTRVLDAKAMFVQNTTQPVAAVAPAKPIRKINTVNPMEIKHNEQIAENMAKSLPGGGIEIEPRIAETTEELADQFSTIKRSPHSKQAPEEIGAFEPEPVIEILPVETKITNDHPAETTEQEIIQGMMMEDMGLKARALFDYQAADESEITFDPGDIITHIDQIDEGWWQGLGPSGLYGLFPANYVELIN